MGDDLLEPGHSQGAQRRDEEPAGEHPAGVRGRDLGDASQRPRTQIACGHGNGFPACGRNTSQTGL